MIADVTQDEMASEVRRTHFESAEEFRAADKG